MACYSRLRSFKVTKQQSERDFPQVVNSNLRHICHHIHDTASKTLFYPQQSYLLRWTDTL